MLMSWELKAPAGRSQSDCVHEQVAKADCECPLYKQETVKGRGQYADTMWKMLKNV